ncbi:MAG: ISAs1 family transposase [Verrucomicrobiota bacterium]|jgi:predicted transposase YbfD/YdcC|nr:ISAs1 family transposase [Verrucomicrobiota bacterium]|tara:strand:- start:104 stop:1246 length:1143 start_codon:yes stop_codon:yes gene_type:complete
MASKSILRDFFSDVPDPRVERTRKHQLNDVILIVLIGMITGCRSWSDMHWFVEMGPPEIREMLELPNGVPSKDTLRRVISALNPGAFRDGFIGWAQSLCKSTKGKLVAIDGKTVRGARRDGDGFGALHLVNAWVKENAITLGQYATDVKSNEITAIPELLKLLSLEGAIVSMDAMGCQKEIAKEVRAQGADYLFGLKKNQPSLHKEVLGAFGKETCRALELTPGGFHESNDKGHGRIEKRRTWVLHDVEWLTMSDSWKDLKSLVLVESQRTLKGETTTELRAYISSLVAPAKRMNELVRGHWEVENNLHWVLDVTFGEDHTRVSKRNGAENLALIRKMALNMIKHTPVNGRSSSLVMRQRLASRRPNYLRQVLSAGITED